MARPRIWLLSAYRAQSHVAWADWLEANQPQIEWHRLELPGRHFRWRIRGNPLSWLDALPEALPDRLLATSMVDLATLKGLHPRLAPVPADYYFHENQFAYPANERQAYSLEPQLVQLYGALAADRLLFNSAYNRDSFLEGVDALARRVPAPVPDGLAKRLHRKCVLLPVPIEPITPAAARDERLIVWNHRWEYDKAPERFARALRDLAASGVDFRLALLGPRSRKPPAPLIELRATLAQRIVADGKLDQPEYCDVLGRAGIVVSTALHEFQGLAILEAASAGARPLVPDALCYCEQCPAPYRYPSGDLEALRRRLTRWLTEGLPPSVDVSPWYGCSLRPRWTEMLGSADTHEP